MRIGRLTGTFMLALVFVPLVIAVSPQRVAYARGHVGAGTITHSGIGFKQPGYLTVDIHGVIYVSDQGNNRVQKLSPRGKVLGVWSRGLSQPTGIAVDAHGTVYVADQGNNRIVKLSSQGQLVAAWSTKARTGLLTNVADVAVDAQEHVYVSEGGVNLIRELSSTGVSLVTWQ